MSSVRILPRLFQLSRSQTLRSLHTTPARHAPCFGEEVNFNLKESPTLEQELCTARTVVFKLFKHVEKHTIPLEPALHSAAKDQIAQHRLHRLSDRHELLHLIGKRKTALVDKYNELNKASQAEERATLRSEIHALTKQYNKLKDEDVQTASFLENESDRELAQSLKRK